MPILVTYNSDLTRPLDRVRFALGDAPGETDAPNSEADVLLGDETITAALLAYNVNLMAAQTSSGEKSAARFLARGLIARYSLLPDTIISSSKRQITWASRLAHWSDLVRGTGNASTGISAIGVKRSASAVSEF